MNFDRTKVLLAEALRQKEERRRRFAKASFGEKILIVENMREGLLPLQTAKLVQAASKFSTETTIDFSR
jgi:hypothetical protein